MQLVLSRPFDLRFETLSTSKLSKRFCVGFEKYDQARRVCSCRVSK